MNYSYPYQLVTSPGSAAAKRPFGHLLTGRVGQTVSLQGLPSGQYVYRLLVAGQPVGAPQKLVLLP